ncbi:hypothetical protein [Hyperthermus butylicus]|uniref:hypothetical protein n=1 Tax=Hyperthermus butylicus TaxID=54248 RepID=UPI00129A3768|nr:hypothetical protein [Hyperthermus butylicus]
MGRLEAQSIVVENKCDERIVLEAIEVKYYVVVNVRGGRDGVIEERPARREITERIGVDSVLDPGSRFEVYFGTVENIEELNVIVRVGDKLYRVPLAAEASSGTM